MELTVSCKRKPAIHAILLTVVAAATSWRLIIHLDFDFSNGRIVLNLGQSALCVPTDGRGGKFLTMETLPRRRCFTIWRFRVQYTSMTLSTGIHSISHWKNALVEHNRTVGEGSMKKSKFLWWKLKASGAENLGARDAPSA